MGGHPNIADAVGHKAIDKEEEEVTIFSSGHP